MYLGIETSCDETSLALLTEKSTINLKKATSFIDYINSFEVVSSIISSQIDVHSQYGGVIPEIGARKHAQQIHWIFQDLIQKALKKNPSTELDKKNDEKLSTIRTNSQLNEDGKKIVSSIKGIFVTTEPGLLSALRVGEEFAKTLQYFVLRHNGVFVPIIRINHLKGHVTSCFFHEKKEPEQKKNLLDNEIFPHLHLLVSGGNSQIILLKNWKEWEIIGQTLDDAAGETLDKIGRMIGLPYPGGVYISKIAKLTEGNPVNFPEGMKKSNDLNYSFSGLKTAVRYNVLSQTIPHFSFEEPLSFAEIQKLVDFSNSNDLYELDQKLRYIQDVCISAQTMIIGQLLSKIKKAIKQKKPKSLGVSGGVSANGLLRKKFGLLSKDTLLPFFLPHISLTGDNAVMIALAGLSEGYLSSDV